MNEGINEEVVVDQPDKGIDWTIEADALSEGDEFWKPEAGQHKGVFLSNGEFFRGPDFHGVEVDKCRFMVEVAGKQKFWTIQKRLGKNSLYGQIAALGKKAGGKVRSQPFTLLVKGEGKQKDYTIMEVL